VWLHQLQNAVFNQPDLRTTYGNPIIRPASRFRKKPRESAPTTRSASVKAHESRAPGKPPVMIGCSPAIRRVVALIERIAPSSISVLISGESGTGKELVARAIHLLSPRRDGPYVPINCAAIPDTLMESELFGHERGAFTGASARRAGHFEQASRGTLLLDEITEMKIDLQAKLLRVIEEQKFRRLGGSAEVALDVRVMAASNRNLERAVREGRLRLDLYYRLKVLTIDLPPLRERADDIPLLVNHFIEEFSHTNPKVHGVDDNCLKALESHQWPGNIRELRHLIQGAIVISHGPLLSVMDLPSELRSTREEDLTFAVRPGTSIGDIERKLIHRTIKFTGGNKTRAAELLGISVRALYYRLQRYRNDTQSSIDLE
jgi:transcriptional regulator with PAS, ATPase and Fis domain